MKHQLLFLAAVVAATFAVIVIAMGLAHNTDAILAPARMLMLLIGVAIYASPSALAVHRDCKATGGIISLNILLGWTVVGWLIALSWAAWGKARTAPPTIPAPPGAVVTGR
jgi:hypothetical protein